MIRFFISPTRLYLRKLRLICLKIVKRKLYFLSQRQQKASYKTSWPHWGVKIAAEIENVGRLFSDEVQLTCG